MDDFGVIVVMERSRQGGGVYARERVFMGRYAVVPRLSDAHRSIECAL